MSRYVTLGGNRLGAGNQMKQRLPEHGRSTHNLTRTWHSSIPVGLLVPCFKDIALPNDTWNIKIAANIFTKPTLGPMFSTFKFEVHVFYAPDRLYNGALHNNALGVGSKMETVKYPKIQWSTKLLSSISDIADVDNAYFSASSLNAYMGFRCLPFSSGTTRQLIQKRGSFYIMYADIFKNAYANKQETNAYVIASEKIEQAIQYVEVLNKKNQTTTKLLQGQRTFVTFASGARFIKEGMDIAELQWTYRVKVYGRNLDENLQLCVAKNTGSTATVYKYKISEAAVAGSIVNDGRGSLTFEIDAASVMKAAGEDAEKALAMGTLNVSDDGNHKQFIVQGSFGVEKAATESLQEMPVLKAFPLVNIDNARKAINSYNDGTAVTITGTGGSSRYLNYAPYVQNITTRSDGEYMAKTPLVGLLAKTYQADIFNAWLNGEFLNYENTPLGKKTLVSVNDGKFAIDSLLLAEKMFNLYNTINMQGGTYKDWRKAMWSVENVGGIETPMYIGGLSTEIYFQEVTNQAETAEGTLGSLAGRGRFGQMKGGKIRFKPKEEGMIMAIASITPRIAYCQGSPWWGDMDNMQELHTPSLDGIGFEDLMSNQMAGWAENNSNNIPNWQASGIGKVPAWIWYQTAVDEVFGDLAEETKQNYMVLTRNYEPEYMIFGNEKGLRIKDSTTYIDPTKYNQCFADASLTAQNFWVGIKFEVECRREMSASLIPRA